MHRCIASIVDYNASRCIVVCNALRCFVDYNALRCIVALCHRAEGVCSWRARELQFPSFYPSFMGGAIVRPEKCDVWIARKRTGGSHVGLVGVRNCFIYLFFRRGDRILSNFVDLWPATSTPQSRKEKLISLLFSHSYLNTINIKTRCNPAL